MAKKILSDNAIDKVKADHRRLSKIPANSPPDPPMVGGSGWVPKFRRFQLTTALTKGSSASARIVTQYPGATTPTMESGATVFTVYDPFYMFAGVAGKKGYAMLCPDNGHWEIIQLVC